MPKTLKLQPREPAPALRIEAVAARSDAAALKLLYRVIGAVDRVLIPPPAPPERADGLWRRTCFEAFVRAPGEAGYFELNFSPSGQYAAYRFSDYREGMAAADELSPPLMEMRSGGDRYELSATVDLGRAFGLLAALPWQIGLSAILEDRNGGRSHWALAHPPGEADFHHRDCFALQLPPPERG